MTKIPKEWNKPGISNTFHRNLYIWWHAPIPHGNTHPAKKWKYIFKFYAGHYFFTKIGPQYHRFITWVTHYYPFSLLYRGSWIHAESIKAKDMRYALEDLASDIGLFIRIDNGRWDKPLSVFYGKFAEKVPDKQEAIIKLQKECQQKYGDVFVQDENRGFRILVNNNLLT